MKDHDRPSKIFSEVHHDEATRRRLVISQSLRDVLSSEGMQHAIRVCDEQFAPEVNFSASEYLRQLVTALPHLQLDQETRLGFLRTSRLSIDQLGPQADAIPPAAGSASEPEIGATEELAAPHEPFPDTALQGRREARKSTYLTGSYRCEQTADESGQLVVQNVSHHGLGLRVLGAHRIEPGAILQIQFTLDDHDETEVETRFEVRWVHGQNMGGLILSPSNFSPAFTAYLERSI